MSVASMASGKKSLKRASPSTIQDKFLVGYQGWFSCAGDGEPIHPGHSGWLHWFNGDRPNLDVWPDVSSYSPSELFPARDMKLKTGDQAFLFSSRHPKTVQRHFHWMAEHGIDGAFLQRFAEQCQPGQERSIRKLRDDVGQLVRDAAEKEGRVFAIMYDVSSVPADRIQNILECDWIHLIHDLCVLDSPSYLREKGKPVIGLWGFGFDTRGHTPHLVRSIVKFFRTMTPGGAYIFGGAPSCWRLSEGDADRHPEFVDVWLNEFDAISPWTIGRYRNEAEAEKFAESKMKDDMELIKRRNEETGRKVDYVPVVHPGGSGFNLSKGNWAFNDAPRMGGRFLWKQLFNAKRLGVRSLYGAMWDEYDEGTAFMPIVTHKQNLPQSDTYRFMALDEDGCDLPSDWYMRICGMAAEGLRSERWIHETFPLKELQDYWSSHPKYEEIDMYQGRTVCGPSSSGSNPKDEVSGDGQAAYQEWLSSQSDDKDELPPPPYSLLVEEPSTSTSRNVQPTQTQQTLVGISSSTISLPPSPSVYGSPTVSPEPSISNVGQSIPIAAQVYTNGTPTILTAAEPLVASTPQTSYIQERPTINVPLNHAVPFTASTSPGLHSPSSASSNVQGQQYQRQRRPSDPVLSLASDFTRAVVTGPPIGSPREDSGFVESAVNMPVAAGRPVPLSPPPLHPAHPAANKPTLYGRPSISRPPSTHSHSPRPLNAAPPSPGQWSSHWPPKEWGISDPSPSGGANLGRLQTFNGSSSVNSVGSNLRPSPSISGYPLPPTHSHSSTRPSTAGDVSHGPTSSAHVPATDSFAQYPPQSVLSEYPPAGFSEVSPHSTHTPSPPPGGYGPAPYLSGPGASASYYTSSHYYPRPHLHHDVGVFMPSGPQVGPSPQFHSHHDHHSFPQPSMPPPWMPTGPGMPVGPVGPVGPMGPIGPNTGLHPPQPGRQYVHGDPSYSARSGNSAINYALSAVDMVAGRKTRDQLQDLANKFLK